MKKKKSIRQPPVTVFERGEPKDKDYIKIAVDKHNWILSGLGSNKFFSKFQGLVRHMYQSGLKSRVRALEMEKTKEVVAELEGYLVELATGIGERFTTTPFATPERRHETQRNENNKPRG